MAGVIIAFVSKPPALDEVGSEKWWKWIVERPQTPEAIKAWGEKAARSKKLKFKFSFVGVGLLIAGTGLQFAGTVWQVVRMACRG